MKRDQGQFAAKLAATIRMLDEGLGVDDIAVRLRLGTLDLYCLVGVAAKQRPEFGPHFRIAERRRREKLAGAA